MAYQGECDCCHEFSDADSLIYIERYEQMLCDYCINEIINSLESEDERKVKA